MSSSAQASRPTSTASARRFCGAKMLRSPTDIIVYSSSTIQPIEKRMSSISISSASKRSDAGQPDYAINRFSQKYDSYHALLYRNSDHTQNHQQTRRRLSSTGEGSGDSSTTASGSSCGEREDGSEGRAESDEMERYESNSGGGSSRDEDERTPLEGQVTEIERQQVETFFRGLKTQVYVSSSLANLYTKSPADHEWQLKFTGIPLVLLDIGEARSRNKRRIQIVLAERGTCFMLWRDTIDNLSSYKVAGKAFHTMCYSSDHTVQVGFSFDTVQAAQDMWNEIEKLISCPENISLSLPGKKKRKERKPPKPAPLPSKSHISQPCCFQHVTSVDQNDRSRYYTLKEFVPLTAFMARKPASLDEF